MKREYCEDYDILKDQVTDKPYKGDLKPICPNGCDKYQKIGGCRTTLVGFVGPINPNHRWTSCTCSNCYCDYTWEVQGLNQWITIDNRLRLGIPSCFESYIYNCKCGGNINKESGSILYENKGGVVVRNYPRTYKCDKCDFQRSLTD